MTMAIATPQTSEATKIDKTSDARDELSMHKDRISAAELNLSDPYVASAVGLFAIHNVIRRNLRGCAANAKDVKHSKEAAFFTYARYTLYVLEDQLQAEDLVWFPEFAKGDPGFEAQISSHNMLFEQILTIRAILEPGAFPGKGAEISIMFSKLSEAVDVQYDKEEHLSNKLGHIVPLDTIRVLEEQQEQRRKRQVKPSGHLWSAIYVLRRLSPKEREIFPPGIPKMVVSGMLTAGALQFREELQFAPKF